MRAETAKLRLVFFKQTRWKTEQVLLNRKMENLVIITSWEQIKKPHNRAYAVNTAYTCEESKSKLIFIDRILNQEIP